jgi:hypothetical protein
MSKHCNMLLGESEDVNNPNLYYYCTGKFKEE